MNFAPNSAGPVRLVKRLGSGVYLTNHSVQSLTSTRSGSNTSTYRECIETLVENEQEGQRILQSGRPVNRGHSVTTSGPRSIREWPSAAPSSKEGIHLEVAYIASMPKSSTPRSSNHTWLTPQSIRPVGLQRPPLDNTLAPNLRPRVPTPLVIQKPKMLIDQQVSTVAMKTGTSSDNHSEEEIDSPEHCRKKQQEMRCCLQESQAHISQQFV